MHRRSFLSLIGLAPLVTAVSATPHLVALEADPLPIEPWREGPETLERWRRAPRQPVWDSVLPELTPLIASLRKNQQIQFAYSGGTTPGSRRIITPGQLYAVNGFSGHYLSGYCHLRNAERTFLVARMRAVQAL